MRRLLLEFSGGRKMNAGKGYRRAIQDGKFPAPQKHDFLGWGKGHASTRNGEKGSPEGPEGPSGWGDAELSGETKEQWWDRQGKGRERRDRFATKKVGGNGGVRGECDGCTKHVNGQNLPQGPPQIGGGLLGCRNKKSVHCRRTSGFLPS